MGLFSTKYPQPPLPDIGIHLSNPADKVYRPDDIVNGWVTFTPTVPIAPRAIVASLWGHAQIWHRTSHTNSNNSSDYHHWRDNAPLFEVQTNILQTSDSKPSTLEVGRTYTYPFQFRFPIGTANNRGGQYQNDADARWTVGPHQLPPTFWSSSNHSIEGAPNWAKVEYGVRVRLACPGVGVAQGHNLVDFVVNAPVLFAPLNRSAHTSQAPPSLISYTKSCSLRTSALARPSSSSVGFRQSMRDHFSSKTPRLDFDSVLHVPDVMTSGCEFSFGAAVKILDKSDTVSHIPPIHFTILRLELQDFTSIRAPRDHEASTVMSGSHRGNKYENMPAPDTPFSIGEHNSESKEAMHLNCLPHSTTVELAEVPGEEKKEMVQANSCEAWFTARVPGYTPPSFRSFAISRTYRVKIKLGIEIGGKKFEHEVKSWIHEMGSAPT